LLGLYLFATMTMAIFESFSVEYTPIEEEG